MRLDGTHFRRLTTFAIHAGAADWAPDGSGRRFVSAQSVESHQPDWESVR